MYMLPALSAPSLGLPTGFSATGLCRARDVHGNWWIVNPPNRSGYLSFVPQTETVWKESAPHG